MSEIFQNNGFRIHFSIYLAVNLLLLVLNLTLSPHHLWFYWPLLGWGLGIVVHAFAVYGGVDSANRNTAQRNRPGQ